MNTPEGRRISDQRKAYRNFAKQQAASTEGTPLRANPKMAQALLALPQYKGVDTVDLIELAKERNPALFVTDRAAAIAILYTTRSLTLATK